MGPRSQHWRLLVVRASTQPSNPSDGPSRGEAPMLEALGITAVKGEAPLDFEEALAHRWKKETAW